MGKGLSEQEKLIMAVVEDHDIVWVSDLYSMWIPSFDFEQVFHDHGGRDWKKQQEMYKQLLQSDIIWSALAEVKDDHELVALAKMHLDAMEWREHRDRTLPTVKASVSRSISRLQERGLVRRCYGRNQNNRLVRGIKRVL